jgi:phosphoenolpyruvate synthase/pyruvate phosphate dikinase
MNDESSSRTSSEVVNEHGLILDLKEASRKIAHLIGGKAASLGELLSRRFPVPPGFVVTTRAYDHFVSRNNLDGIIRELKGPHQAELVRRAFIEAEVPREVIEAIARAYRKLSKRRVAVRSSATAEDLPEAAFAGQHDTYLNVEGLDAVINAIKGCWASLWSERAVLYREKKGIDHSRVKMAVIVQEIVDAEVSGVLFTANPVTGARKEVVINTYRGLGEAVVSGRVTPDHYVLAKTRLGWRILEKHVYGGSQVVDDKTLKKLASLGTSVQQLFGTPQDIEWAIENGRIYILQSRPITALPEPPPRLGRLQHTLILMLAEFLPSRPYPLELAWVESIFQNAVGRVASYFGIKVSSISEVFEEEDGIVVSVKSNFKIRPTLRVILAPIKTLILAARYKASQWLNDPLLKSFEGELERVATVNVYDVSWNDLTSLADNALTLTRYIGEIRRRYLPSTILSALILRLWLGALRRGKLFPTLMFACLRTKVVEANEEIKRLTLVVRSDKELSKIFTNYDSRRILEVLRTDTRLRYFYNKLEEFLEKYGHREISGSMLISSGTWREKPEIVVDTIKSYLNVEVNEHKDTCSKFNEALSEVFSNPLMRINGIKSVFKGLLENARELHRIREDTRFYAMKIVPVLRSLFAEAGRRLKAQGFINDADDVYYLKFSELKEIDEWSPSSEKKDMIKRTIEKRKHKWESLRDKPFIDYRLLLARRRGRNIEGAVLTGIPASPGVAEGVVKVIRDAGEFYKLRPGDVLVSPYTTPAWTPLFRIASAVVTDSGGPLSHAAITAREYGIPAVVGTGQATKLLSDGIRVRVDGYQGAVYIIEG